MMKRLTIMAEFNNDPREQSIQVLLARGNKIFGQEEQDFKTSANFLIIVLASIEKWA